MKKKLYEIILNIIVSFLKILEQRRIYNQNILQLLSGLRYLYSVKIIH